MKEIIKQILKFNVWSLISTVKANKRDKNFLGQMQSALKSYQSCNTITKLHIGAGSNVISGWFNTDLKPTDNIYLLDAGVKFPIQDMTFDYIYCEHLFEHLTFSEQVNLLTESYRVLKSTGVLRIATPDMEFLIKLYTDNEGLNIKYINWSMQHSQSLRKIESFLNGKNDSKVYVINNFFHAWGHKQIHNKASLSSLGLQCGFSSAAVCEVGKSPEINLKNIEHHGTIIPGEMNQIETMILEFYK